jgi:hypothetical protein
VNAEKETTKPDFGKELLSGTVVMAIGTLAGYLAAFYFETGYFSYFSIPSSLVQLTLTNIL